MHECVQVCDNTARLIVALKIFHYDKMDNEGVSCVMKNIYPHDTDKQISNVLPIMFNNAIECELEDWTITNLELANITIPNDLKLTKPSEEWQIYLRRVTCRMTVPLVHDNLCYPFTYTALSMKIVTTG